MATENVLDVVGKMRKEHALGPLKLFAYTHRRDADGICSAAIMLRAAKEMGIDLTLDFIDYEPISDLKAAFNDMGQLPKSSHIIIADLGCDDMIMQLKISAFRSITTDGGIIEWLDHHEWKDDVRDKISHYASVAVADSKGDNAMCAAELVAARFMPGDRICKMLASVAHDSDLGMWKTDPPKPEYAVTFALGALITYYNYKSEQTRERDGDEAAMRDFRERLCGLASELSKMGENVLTCPYGSGLKLPEKLTDDLETYTAMEKSRRSECIDTAVRCDINGHKAVVGFADPVLSASKMGHELIEKFQADIAVVIFESGKISFRRSFTSHAKCNAMAGLFNGGGHEYAAGGTLGHRVTDRNAVLREVLEKLGG